MVYVDGVKAGVVPPAMGEDRPAVVRALGVHGDDDTLVAELLGRLPDELRTLHRRGIDRDLVGASVEQAPHVLDLALLMLEPIPHREKQTSTHSLMISPT